MRSFYAEGQFTTDEGELLTLVCDFAALDVIEAITGENWDAIVPQLVSPPKSLLVKVLFGLLRRRHEGVTLDDAAGLTYDKNANALGAIMGDVIGRACNFDDDSKEAKGENPPAPHGQSSDSDGNG